MRARVTALALLTLPALARAQQDTTRLPSVVVTATPDKPGARKLVGFVGDTGATPIEGAEISIPGLQRRVFSRADGTFRLDSVPRGKYQIRARKLGYAPQIRTFQVDADGGTGAFALLPLPYSLPPIVTSTERAGLSGVVGDTAYNAIVGAEVRVMGEGHVTHTDSSGAFWMPVKPGSYIVAVKQPGFDYRLVSVVVPEDSGKRIAVTLRTQFAPVPHREANNLADFGQRLAWRMRKNSRVFSHADLEEMHAEWVYDVVRQTYNNLGGLGVVSKDCEVTLNGGPTTAVLGRLTIDDVEMVEVYLGNGYSSAGNGKHLLRPQNPHGQRVPITNNERATLVNAVRLCTPVYVWTR